MRNHGEGGKMVQTTISVTVDAEVFLCARSKADSEKGNLSLVCESALREYAKLPIKMGMASEMRLSELYKQLSPQMRDSMKKQCKDGSPIKLSDGKVSPFTLWAKIINNRFGPVPIVTPEEIAAWSAEVSE